MVFLFLLDITCSILCKCVFKIGSWVVYKSYDGMYYLYNSRYNTPTIKDINTNTDIENIKNETNLSPYVIITEEEYDNLRNEKNTNNDAKKNCKIHKRNVSTLTKKMVASSQEWKCGLCNQILDYTYEIDHHIPLFKGGSNEISNLIALCRNCHGKKTLLENNNIKTIE
jgi:5-methylcytosine-specific restriction endonuclease McrA